LRECPAVPLSAEVGAVAVDGKWNCIVFSVSFYSLQFTDWSLESRAPAKNLLARLQRQFQIRYTIQVHGTRYRGRMKELRCEQGIQACTHQILIIENWLANLPGSESGGGSVQRHQRDIHAPEDDSKTRSGTKCSDA
jgi:hypothetical protein